MTLKPNVNALVNVSISESQTSSIVEKKKLNMRLMVLTASKNHDTIGTVAATTTLHSAHRERHDTLTLSSPLDSSMLSTGAGGDSSSLPWALCCLLFDRFIAMSCFHSDPAHADQCCSTNDMRYVLRIDVSTAFVQHHSCAIQASDFNVFDEVNKFGTSLAAPTTTACLFDFHTSIKSTALKQGVDISARLPIITW